MRKFHVTRFSAATAAAAGISSVVAAMALAPAPVLADSGAQSSAFGLAATGVVPIPPTPMVESSGPLVTKNLASLPSNPAISASLLDVAAQADAAKASVAQVDLGGEMGIKATVLDAACKGNTGNADIGSLQIAGQPQQVAGAPANTQIQVPPGAQGIVSIIVNKQVPNANGGVTVTALEISVDLSKLPAPPAGLPAPPPGAPAETIDVSQANCAAAPTSTGTGTPPPAPAPKPGQGTLPVTG